MAMSAYYLKGIAPPQVQLTQIFSGCMPFLAWCWSRWCWSTCSRPSPTTCRTSSMAAEPRRKRRLALPPGPMDAVDLRDRLASGALRAVELAEACLDRAREAEPRVQAWEFLDPAHVMRQAEALDRLRAVGPADRAAARAARRDQGHHRHRRHADRERHPDRRRPPAADRRRGRGPAARRGRAGHGQDGLDRARLFHARQDAQPARSRAHAGRLVLGLGRGGCGRHGAARRRHADRRVGDPPRRLSAASSAASPASA